MKTCEMELSFDEKDFEAVRFDNNIHSRIKIRPMYYELGFSAAPDIFGRRVVLEKIINALDYLPDEFGLLVWDVYRPRHVQAKLFEWMRGEIKKRFPHYTDEQNFAEARKYMSCPSKPGDEYCPPHLSGGAVDLTLFNIGDGEPLEMGTVFDDCTEVAHSHYYDLKSQLTLDELKIHERRIMLRSSMEKSGFVSYQYEWWHFDIGDIFWSRKLNVPAVFGPLFGDEEWPENKDEY